MTSKGSIVEGSVTDLLLKFLRAQPHEFTALQLADLFGKAQQTIDKSLGLLCDIGQVRRKGGRPALYRFIDVELRRAGADILAAAVVTCPLYAIRLSAMRAATPSHTPSGGMPISMRNRLMVQSFDGQRPEIKRRYVLKDHVYINRIRVRKLGVTASNRGRQPIKRFGGGAL